MADYKDRFYRAYYSSHIVPRKGEFTLERFRAYARVYDHVWRSILPADKNARILDAGCGSGSLVWWLQQRGWEQAGGIDVSAEQVAIANALGVRNVVEGDLIPFLADKQGWYDRVILRDVVEHFPRDAIVDMLDGCRRALRPGGALVIQVPNAGTPLWGRIRHGDFTHEMAFTEGSLQQLLAVIGFDDVRFLPAGPVLQGARGLPRHLLWKGVEAFYKMLVYAETGRRHAIVTEGIIAMATVGPADGAPA
jgi:2-polyprenyl-3-methyl-5-hydroxy-6-metoxy-1,4-benzoquinol methylase